MNNSNGIPSLVSAIVAMIGLIAATHPRWTLMATLSQHAPELRDALPYVLTLVGSLGAAISHPPQWLRDPVVSAWQRVRGLVPKAGP